MAYFREHFEQVVRITMHVVAAKQEISRLPLAVVIDRLRNQLSLFLYAMKESQSENYYALFIQSLDKNLAKKKYSRYSSNLLDITKRLIGYGLLPDAVQLTEIEGSKKLIIKQANSVDPLSRFADKIKELQVTISYERAAKMNLKEAKV